MPKRPTCQYRDWERIIKRDEDGEGTLIVIRKDYNCTTGTQPSIQDVCKFFDLDWLCLSDKDRENEDEWTQKEWKDLPPTHPCKWRSLSLSKHTLPILCDQYLSPLMGRLHSMGLQESEPSFRKGSRRPECSRLQDLHSRGGLYRAYGQ